MKTIRIIFLFMLCFEGAYAQYSANDFPEEEVLDYESIVRELSPTTRARVQDYGGDPLSQVRFHMGVGFTNSILALTGVPEGVPDRETLKGVQAKFGIDLLSPFWRAEGGVVTYETHRDKEGNKFALKEFDLSLISLTPTSKLWGYKIGGGLSARYLEFTQKGMERIDYTTPSANIQLGVLTYFSNKMTLSTDLLYRKALTKESIDQSALDFSIRIDGHF